MTSRSLMDPSLQAEGVGPELLAALDAQFESLHGLRVPEIRRGVPSPVAKVPFKVLVFRQVITYRACDLADAYVREANARAFVPCFLLSRALFEGACALYDLSLRIEALLASGEASGVDGLDTHVMLLMHGTKSPLWRSLGASVQSINVLTLIDRVTKKLGAYVSEAYEDLSEFCHPNAAGGTSCFAPPDLSPNAAVFLASPALADPNGVRWHIRATNVALFLHLQAAELIHRNSPAFTALCEKAMHEAGQWPSGLPYPTPPAPADAA